MPELRPEEMLLLIIALYLRGSKDQASELLNSYLDQREAQ